MPGSPRKKRGESPQTGAKPGATLRWCSGRAAEDGERFRHGMGRRSIQRCGMPGCPRKRRGESPQTGAKPGATLVRCACSAAWWAHFLSFRLTPPSPFREPIALHWKERLKSGSQITDWGAQMKKAFLLVGVVFSWAIVLQAGNKPQTGTIISENPGACGPPLGKGKKNKQTSLDVRFQEYFVPTP